MNRVGNIFFIIIIIINKIFFKKKIKYVKKLIFRIVKTNIIFL